MSEFIIQTNNLSKTYNGDVQALKSLNLTIQEGESVGYVGPNGAGKTTTIQILLNLIRPTRGGFSLFGKIIKGHSKDIFRQIGALVEIPGFYDYLNPDQILTFICRIYRVPKDVIDSKISDTLKLVRLGEVRYEKVGSFSTGMRRRLAIAQVLVHDPLLIILDEPTSGLDPKGVREVRDIIKNLNKMGKTIFISSHNLTEISEIAERIIFLNKGEVIEDTQMSALHGMIKSRRIGVKFKGDLSSNQKETLENIPEIENIEYDKLVFIDYKESVEDPEVILQKLVSMKFAISSFTPQTMTLEDLYLNLYAKEETLR
ncbi:MAG: ABC transporter ATP-binding protein [Candidatus Kariarchaeaceae archaeon]|jgi:ABC-2 type transport system ATP-binding protein